MTTLEEHRQLRDQARVYGAKIDVNPYTVLLDEVKWRAGHVEYLRERIAESDWEDLFEGGFTNEETGQTYPTEDGPLLRRYDRERQLLDKVCNIAARLGVAERYVGLAELQGRVIFEALQAALSDPRVGLTEGQRVELIEALRRATSSTNGHGKTPSNVLDLPKVPT